MLLEVPVSLKERLAQLDHDLPRLKYYELGPMFDGVVRSAALCDDERKGALAEVMIFNLRPGDDDDQSCWGTHFGPTFRLAKDDGTELQIPDLSEFDAAIIDYWEQRSRQAVHPVLRARYADAVWDLAERVTETRPSFKCAQTAIDAYLETITSEKYDDALEAIFYAKRGLKIALAINDRTRIDKSKTTLLRLLGNSTADPKLIGLWAIGFDALYDPGNKRLALTESEKTQLVSLLEDILRRCSDSSGSDFSPWASQAAAQRLARHHQRSGTKEDLRQVIQTSGKAFESIASEADPLVAMSWLQPVIDEYHNRGMADDEARATLLSQEKGKNIRDSLRTIKVSTEVEPGEIDRFIDSLIEGDLDEALARITAHFIPRAQEVRDLLLKMRQVAPLSSLMPLARVEEGRFVGAAGSLDQDPDGRLVMQLSQNLGITAQFLTIAMERARERHALDADKVASFLFVSPVYDASRWATLQEALRAYFSGDLVKFVHMAVPQIEQALRTLLGLLGQPIFKTTRQGSMDVKNLNDLLREEPIKGCFNEDIWLYLRTFFADRRGINLRNDLCHGLLVLDHITLPLANQVLHVLLTLALVRENKGPGTPDA